MATSIECSACGHAVPGDQPFCGMCGTPAHVSPGSTDEAGSPATFLGEVAGRVRVPWSLGLLGVLVMGSVVFGGEDPPDVAPAGSMAAPIPSAVETEVELPDPSAGIAAQAAAPEVDDSDSKDAAAARLALIEAERMAEEQRQLELNEQRAREAAADLQRRLEEQVQADYAEAQAAARAAAAEATESDAVDRPSPSPTPSESTERGSLRLIVLPFGDIYVNGALQARDMSRFELSLPPGTYDVRLENANRQPVDTSVVIRAGESTGVRVTLPSRNN